MPRKDNFSKVFLQTEDELIQEIEKAVCDINLRALKRLLGQAFTRGILKKNPEYYYCENAFDLAQKEVINPWVSKKIRLQKAKNRTMNLTEIATKYPLTLDILESRKCIDGLINSIAYGIDEDALVQYINMHGRMHGVDEVVALDYEDKKKLAFLLLHTSEEELDSLKTSSYSKKLAISRLQNNSMEVSLWLKNEKRTVTVFRYLNTNTYFTPNLCVYREDLQGKRHYSPIKVISALDRWKFSMESPKDCYSWMQTLDNGTLKEVKVSDKSPHFKNELISVGSEINISQAINISPIALNFRLMSRDFENCIATNYFLSKELLSYHYDKVFGSIDYSYCLLVRLISGEWLAGVRTGTTPIILKNNAVLEIGDLVTLPEDFPARYWGQWIIKRIDSKGDYATANVYSVDDFSVSNNSRNSFTVPVSFLSRVGV